MLRAGVFIVYYKQCRVSLCVRGFFIVVIAEGGNRCVRGGGPLFESVVLTTVHILYRHQ